MRHTSWIVAIAITFASTAAHAGLDRATLAGIGYHVEPGAHIALDARVGERGVITPLRRLIHGRPSVITFVDYRCHSLCGIVFDRLAAQIPAISQRLGRDYEVIAISLDPTQTSRDAETFRARHLGTGDLARGIHLATEDVAAHDALTSSVGLVAPYDAEHARFAHPAGLLVVAGDGRVKAVLSPFAIDPRNIALALQDEEASASLGARLLQLCYGYDAATGIYNVRIQRVLASAAAATLLMIGIALTVLLRLDRRAQTREPSRR